MRISTAGKLNRFFFPGKKDAAAEGPLWRRQGFTLIELIVVMVLISLLMVFAAPRLHKFSFQDTSRKASMRILATVRQLKERAVTDQQHYILHVDASGDRAWITSEAMTDDEQISVESENPVALPDDTDIQEVLYPEHTSYESDDYQVHFYPAGYSDPAIIHLAWDEDTRQSFVIEPFLSRVVIHDQYIGYDDK